MAALFDLDAERDVRAANFAGATDGGADQSPDDAFGVIRAHIGGLEARPALLAIRRYESQLAAMRTAVVASVTVARGERAAKRMLDDGKTSKGAIRRASKRAAAAAENTDLVDKVAKGDISEEHLDVIAEANDRTDGAAAVDNDFIDEVAATTPDQAKAAAAKYVAKKQDPNGVQSTHDRQRRQRRVITYPSRKNDTSVLAIEGDSVSVKQMFDAIRDRSNDLYNADGGRDIETGKHPRTRSQRDFDAAHELICDVTTNADGSTTHKPRHAQGRPVAKPKIFVGLTLDKYLGKADGELAEQIGLGLIPDSVLADYLEHADIISVLYDHNGSPLWIGRAKRHASLMQRYALIARDKACVRCGADHAECEVHHLTPWNAPAKGKTDLDNLVLLCGSCHRELHANNHTLYLAHGTWRTRPATAAETPPAPSEHHRRAHSPSSDRNRRQQE